MMEKRISVVCECGEQFTISPWDVDEFNTVACRDCGAWINVSAGQVNSLLDPDGVFSAGGEFLGNIGGRCEDAPCCGCCG